VQSCKLATAVVPIVPHLKFVKICRNPFKIFKIFFKIMKIFCYKKCKILIRVESTTTPFDI